MAELPMTGHPMKERQRARAMRLSSLWINSRRTMNAWAVQLGAMVLMALLSLPAQAESVRELSSFAGVRDNQLVGYGLVVGLDSTGDQTTQAPFTSQSLTNMLSQLGVTVPAGTNLQLRNVAPAILKARTALRYRRFIDCQRPQLARWNAVNDTFKRCRW